MNCEKVLHFYQSITNVRTCRRTCTPALTTTVVDDPMILDFFSYFSLIVFIGCQQVYKCIFPGSD